MWQREPLGVGGVRRGYRLVLPTLDDHSGAEHECFEIVLGERLKIATESRNDLLYLHGLEKCTRIPTCRPDK